MQETMAKWAERFIKRAATNDSAGKRWMAFIGKSGTGKTHAASRIYHFLRAHNVDLWSLRYYPTPPSAHWIRWSAAIDLGPLGWGDLLEDLHRSKFIFLDDVGSEVDKYKSGLPAERLRTALEICKNKWLFLTSNLTRDRFGKAFDARVLSRLEQAAVLDCSDAPDFRTK